MKPQRHLPKSGKATAPAAGSARPKPVRPWTPARKWLFRLIAVVLVPLLLLLVLEGALRLSGYGHRTGFFEKVRVGGTDYLVNNRDFSLRFFPPQLARWPAPIMMPVNKPPGTFRIFILGESAAMGDPEPAYGPGRYLEKLLNERFPEAHFEVVNLGVTAINSNVILPIARACAREQGDLWIIYMGNNEMVGPFGTATVFGAKAVPWPLIRLNLAVQKTRVGQLILAVSRALKGKPKNAAWRGMQMFLGNQIAPDDPRKQVVYENFSRNLRDIVRTGLDGGVKILLSTVAVNLKDCPPFASIPDKNESPEQRSSFERLYAAGCAAEAGSNFVEAAQGFEQAARWRPLAPEVQCRWGECLLQLTHFAAAREHLQLACDDDALPFRADSRINGMIQQTGQEFGGKQLQWFDAVAALETNSPSGICGGESFYEHVHFNCDGSYRLGLAWAQQVEGLLPAALRSHATGGWVSQAICEQRLGLTDWNRSLVLQSVMKRFYEAPLNTQWNNARRLASLQSEIDAMHRQKSPDTLPGVQAFYQDAIRRATGDHFLYEGFAECLQAIGHVEEAVAQWRRVHELLPYDYLADYQMGRLLVQLRQWAEADSALSRSLALHPGFAGAWFERGNVRFGEARFDEALKEYEHARELEPKNPEIFCQMGKALSVLNHSPESITNFQHALELNPDYWEAHYALGGELGMHDRIREAKSQFEDVVRLRPEFSMGHLNLGVALLKLGQLNEAQLEFEETLRLDPESKLAPDYLNRIRALKARKSPP